MISLARLPVHFTPNHAGVRSRTNLCVWHATAGGTLRSSLEWVARPGSSSGFHVGIDRDGSMIISTPLHLIAWHAGESAWPVPPTGVPSHTSVNNRSIGIEFANANDGVEPIIAAQITAAMDLTLALAAVYPELRNPRNHVRHRDISPARKTDPHPDALSWSAFQARLTSLFPPRAA